MPIDHQNKARELRQKLIKEGKVLIDTIKSIDLPKASINPKRYDGIYRTKLAEFNRAEKDTLKSDILKYWKIIIEDDFFYVGNLLEVKDLSNSFKYKGKNNEKRKGNLIYDLNEIISQIDGIDLLMSEFKDIKLLPLVITNTGSVTDKNITIDFDLTNFKDNLYSFNLEHFNGYDEKNSDWLAKKILENDLIQKFFYQHSNMAVEALPIKSQRYSNDLDFYDLKFEVEDFIASSNGFGVVRYEIESLRPGERVWLQPVIVFKGNAGIESISYTILSTCSGEKVSGKITII